MRPNLNFIFSFSCLLFSFSALSQVLPSSRKTDWTKAGYPASIPVYPTILNIIDYGGSRNSSIVNDAALSDAISALNGGEGVIYFPAGTFLFTHPVTLRSGIVLKGEGAANSILQFDLSGAGNLITIEGSLTTDSAVVVLPAMKDSSSVTVDNAGLFTENDYIKVFQNDSALINDAWALGSVGQIMHVQNITGNQINFSAPLRKSYRPADMTGIKKLVMAEGVGIECLKIKRLDATVAQTSNIFFSNAAHCWVKGVESDSCNFAHIRIAGCTNIEVTNSYFHGAFNYGDGGQGYGISCEYTSGDCRIENNIFKHLRHAMLVQSGANGNVFDYNYSFQPFKTDSLPYDLSGDIVLHGNYPYLNLFEGNIVQNIIVDASHGINGPYNTLFRNRASLYGILVSPGAGDSTNLIGNEISGTGFRQGNYFIPGSGNLEYGNNKNDTIIPSGTEMLTEKSFIYGGTPGFWNVASLWPSLGIPTVLRTGTIPAMQRFTNAEPVFCLPAAPVTYIFTGNGNWNIASNWRNNLMPPALLSAGSEIIIDPPADGKAVLNIPVIINPAAALTVRPGKHFEVQSNLTFVK